MNIESQVEILNRICQIMHNSADGRYDEMSCEFEHDTYDEGWSVGATYVYQSNGKVFSEQLIDPNREIADLIHELHELMKSHPGGDWQRLTLTVDGEGRASTKFIYE